MAGNNSIQFLRGNSINRKASSETLLAGQPFYEIDTNKLYVGSSSSTSLKTVRPIGEEQRVTIDSTNLSIEEFIENCEAGSYTSVGTEATIKRCINGHDYKIRLIGTNHDVLADQSGMKVKTTWEFEKKISTSPLGLPFDYKDYKASSSFYPSNMQGFPLAVTLQATLQNIFVSLPPAFQNGIKLVIKPCRIKRQNVNSGGNDQAGNVSVSQRLFLLSATEIGAGTSSNWPVEGTAYSYYSDINNSSTNPKRVKSSYGSTFGIDYWLRSPGLDNSYYWCYVGSGGNVISITDSIFSNNVVPAFCI